MLVGVADIVVNCIGFERNTAMAEVLIGYHEIFTRRIEDN